MEGICRGDPENPRDALAIAEHFQGEWLNGGLSQFFSNWEPADAALVPAALRKLDFAVGAQILEKAIAIMGPQEEWRHRGHDALIDYKSPIGRALRAINIELSAYEETLDAAVVKFEYDLAKASGEEMYE